MILVTGATGLVGGHLVWHLLKTNITITAIKRPTSDLEPLRSIFRFYTPQPDAFMRRIIWKTADVCDELSLIEAMKGIETVYHCAAVVSLGKGNDTMINTNVKGTSNIINAALINKIKHFCFVSSIAACGHTNDGSLIDEETANSHIERRSAYSQSKFYSEQEVWKGINAGLNAVIVNPGVILGYSGTNKGSSELFARVRKGMPFYTLGGSGYIDVQDVVQLMIQITTNNICNERFILVAENRSNKEILNWIAEGYNKKKPSIFISKKVLVAIGYVLEIISKITHSTPTLDRSMALAATSRAFYSNTKIKELSHYNFNPIEKCINEICTHELL